MHRRPPTLFQKCYKSHLNFISSTPYRWKKRAHLATSTCSPRGTSCKSDATVHNKFPAPPSPLRSHSSLPSRALSCTPSPALTSYWLPFILCANHTPTTPMVGDKDPHDFHSAQLPDL
ncbi:hypothetical protein E2C01_016870 [Portunus trituberculatus]|uniref:Uncharacterized protein n=1 Tax=Portunus trituberculatus TaxID=210409 RepID=A0A5B7DRE3_PORTR|nr:hypothetical protein [Portunus trituberculatus]